MAKPRVVMNSAGARAVLTSGPVQAFLKARADRIAASAGPGMVASASSGRSRARAVVVTTTPQAMRGEAKDRRLTRAIDSGRG